MGLFDKITEPILLKEGDSLKKQLMALEELYEQAEGSLREKIGKEIFSVKAGMAGENQVIYELMNSHLPMYIIHDWTITHEDKKAQIDFLAVTRGKAFVLEVKNLWGDITVDNKGQFVRRISYGRTSSKEAMYSPIEQNRKHLELIKEISLSQKGFIRRAQINRWFDTWYQGAVVLANPKMIVNDKFAPKEIKQQLVRADGLTAFIKKVNSSPDVDVMSEKDFTEFAHKLLERNIENPVDYSAKYRRELEQQLVERSSPAKSIPLEPVCPLCGGKLIQRTARKGPSAGKRFYGCENYPRCKGTVNEEQYEKMFNR